jgi:p-cymene monooxygenase electron transfer component
MVDAAITRLTQYGIPLEKIHYDKFTDARDR